MNKRTNLSLQFPVEFALAMHRTFGLDLKFLEGIAGGNYGDHVFCLNIVGIIPSTKEVVEFNGIHKDTDQLWDKYNRKYKNNLYDQIKLYFNNETEFLEHCSAMDEFSVNEDVVILARHQLLTSKKFKYLRDNVPRIDL